MENNSPIAITASFLEPLLVRSLVEILASRRHDLGYGNEKVQPGWQAVDSSSVEAFASGELNLSEESQVTRVPFVTSFLFTCLKGKHAEYRLFQAVSLS